MAFARSILAIKQWRFGRGVLSSTLVSLLMFSGGCSKPKDVTNDPNFGNFKSVVGTWKTKVPLRLVEIEKKLHLVSNLDSYSWERELLVLPEGSEIRIERLIYLDSFETTYLDVMGSIVGGLFSNKNVNVDSSLFTRIGQGTPTQYYSVWNHPSYKKPDWVVAPDKLERVLTAPAPR